MMTTRAAAGSNSASDIPGLFNNMKVIYSALFLSLALALALPAAAQGKIAIVDIHKLFDGYYKTKAADAQLKDQAGDLAKESKAYMEQYQKASDDYKKL